VGSIGRIQKTGGTIYGADDSEKANIVIMEGVTKTAADNRGIAVAGGNEYASNLRRETTAGPGVDLDNTVSGGNWGQ
jgi:hypothetical protein